MFVEWISTILWVAGGAGLCVESQVEQVRTECVVVKCVLVAVRAGASNVCGMYLEWIVCVGSQAEQE